MWHSKALVCGNQTTTRPYGCIKKYISRKKEFEGVEDKPKKQIARLKEILAGLGMTGRLSLDKAKAIREKREFATELGAFSSFITMHFPPYCPLEEDVVAFAAKRGARTEEKAEKRSKKAEKSEEEEEEEPHISEEEQEAAKSQPRRRKVGA